MEKRMFALFISKWRILRASCKTLKRERVRQIPCHEECAEDFLQIVMIFPKRKSSHAGLRENSQNVDLEECVEEIAEYIRQA